MVCVSDKSIQNSRVQNNAVGNAVGNTVGKSISIRIVSAFCFCSQFGFVYESDAYIAPCAVA